MMDWITTANGIITLITGLIGLIGTSKRSSRDSKRDIWFFAIPPQPIRMSLCFIVFAFRCYFYA